jgi:hypothetical protein
MTHEEFVAALKKPGVIRQAKSVKDSDGTPRYDTLTEEKIDEYLIELIKKNNMKTIFMITHSLDCASDTDRNVSMCKLESDAVGYTDPVLAHKAIIDHIMNKYKLTSPEQIGNYKFEVQTVEDWSKWDWDYIYSCTTKGFLNGIENANDDKK